MNPSRVVSLALAAVLPALLGNTCGPTSTGEAASLRFILDARGAGRAPVFVQLSPPSGQPGWITVSRAGQPVYLRSRCEVPDCRNPGVVCGAAIPLVRDMFSSGRVEFEWDGMESVVDPARGCQMQQVAPPGGYVASFCYSRLAETTGDGNPNVAIQGTLVAPVCKDVPFQLPSTGDVTFEVTPGT